MNYRAQIGFEGVADEIKDPDLRAAMNMLVSRLEAHRMDLTSQLRKEPTVFYADPDNNPGAVEGAKAGDVAVWRDDTGTDRFRVLGLD